MNQPILQVVVDLVSFLALADNEVVDEDAAVEQLEHVAALLQKLYPEERDQFLAFIDESARMSEDRERSEFLSSLPVQLGLRQ